MPLPDDYLRYSMRRHGMDQDRYPWSHLFDRKPVAWPNGARVALWIMPIVQWFPLDMTGKPFRAPGGMTMPYPDYRHYTNRDYGNRVGIFRILAELSRRRLSASVAMNAAIARRYPSLVGEIGGQGHEIVAHGLDAATVHHSGLNEEDEAGMIQRVLGTLRKASGQAVTGWLSPGRAESFNTPDILAANGVTYLCDWANDDMPYAMHTRQGDIFAMPHAYETDDRTVLLEFRHTEEDWLQQIKDRFDVLYRESGRYGGRIMSLPVHAWVMGIPSRIGYFRQALDYMLGHDAVWPATGTAILAAFRQQA